MDDIRIIPADEEHLARFRDTLDEVCRERRYLIFLQAPPIDAVRGWFAALVEGGGVQCLAVTAEEQVVGWCDVQRSQQDGRRHVGVLGLGLLAPYRGRGIGRRVAEEAIRRADEAGIERIELQVYTSNERAIALYRALGFEEEGLRRRVRKLDGRYWDELLMARIIEPTDVGGLP